MLVDFRLKVFKTVADRLSFTKAARELLISQPAVTRQINELERQLGVQLFLRRGSSISLTERGIQLLGYANRILSLYGELREEFVSDGEAMQGELRIGGSTTLSQYLLPGILARFRRRYPAVHISLFNGNTEQIEAEILAGRLDYGVIEGVATHPALHYEPFMEDELVLVTATANGAFTRDEITLKELRDLPLVIREKGSGTLDVLEQALRRHSIGWEDLQIEMQLGSSEGIKHYLYHSNCCAFISVQAVLDELAAGRLRVVEVEGLALMRRFNFVSPHGCHSRLTELFKQFCMAK